jgi:predicted component of type VI protein secretion system
MKWASLVIAAAVALVLVTGCPETKSDKKGDKELKITPPANVKVEQGKKTEFEVSVTRTKFNDDVTLTFDLPKDSGLTLEGGNSQKVEKEKDKKTFTLVAAKDANPADGVEAKVAGSSGDLKPDPAKFKVTVAKADKKAD